MAALDFKKILFIVTREQLDFIEESFVNIAFFLKKNNLATCDFALICTNLNLEKLIEKHKFNSIKLNGFVGLDSFLQASNYDVIHFSGTSKLQKLIDQRKNNSTTIYSEYGNDFENLRLADFSIQLDPSSPSFTGPLIESSLLPEKLKHSSQTTIGIYLKPNDSMGLTKILNLLKMVEVRNKFYKFTFYCLDQKYLTSKLKKQKIGLNYKVVDNSYAFFQTNINYFVSLYDKPDSLYLYSQFLEIPILIPKSDNKLGLQGSFFHYNSLNEIFHFIDLPLKENLKNDRIHFICNDIITIVCSYYGIKIKKTNQASNNFLEVVDTKTKILPIEFTTNFSPDDYRPLVSIYMPIKNVQKWIKQAINSVLEQSYSNWELIICDDNSKDESFKIIYAFKDSRIKYLKSPGNGIAAASQFAVTNSKGEICVQLDGDDWIAPDALSIIIRTYKENPKIIGTYSRYIKVSDTGAFLEKEEISLSRFNKYHKTYSYRILLEEARMIISPLRSFKKEVWLKTTGFDTSLASAVDYDMMLKLGEFGDFYPIDKCLYFYRQHPNNISKNLEQQIACTHKANQNALKRLNPIDTSSISPLASVSQDSLVLSSKILDNSSISNLISSDDNLPSSGNKVFVGIASIQARVKSLELTIKSLIDQVDQIGVFLDNYSYIPDFLNNKKILIERSQNYPRKLGDAGKFFWTQHHKGFYFTCDDDLLYPSDYVQKTLDYLERFKEPVAVGWHGSLLTNSFKDYYDRESRLVYTFGSRRESPISVHILGTGCLAFDSSNIDVSLDHFSQANMADLYFALLGQSRKIPFIVIPHEAGQVTEAPESQEVSIYKHSSTGANTQYNTSEKQNLLVKSNETWHVNLPNKKLKLLVVGRFFTHQKGGIYKSSNLIASAYENCGHHVERLCLSELANQRKKIISKTFDFCLAYLPDPNRPDFGEALELIETLAENNTCCAINLSLNLNQDRTDWISNKIIDLNKKFINPRVFLAVFTNGVKLLPGLQTISDYIVTFPKTISINNFDSIKFEDREGIFLGDLSKILDQSLLGGNLNDYLAALRNKMPHVNIYALKQYHTTKKYPKFIKVLDYSKDIESILSKFRLHICLAKYTTFEMTPIESALLGTPVFHFSMPQSLSEYLSPCSIEFQSPSELADMAQLVYESKDIWIKMSESSSLLTKGMRIDLISSQLEIAMRKCLSRSQSIRLIE